MITNSSTSTYAVSTYDTRARISAQHQLKYRHLQTGPYGHGIGLQAVWKILPQWTYFWRLTALTAIILCQNQDFTSIPHSFCYKIPFLFSFSSARIFLLILSFSKTPQITATACQSIGIRPSAQ